MDPAQFRAEMREDARQAYEDGDIGQRELSDALTTFADPPAASSSDSDADGM